ncbi:MAG: NUDIX hydrolase [Chitinophagales bacterium]
MSKKNPWITKSNKEIYNNPWIKVVENQVINPSGNKGIYGVVHFKNIAVGIVPIDKDGFTYLVGQYRYTHNTYEWEIPMGGGLKNTSPLTSAKRELLEETGLKAKKWKIILESQVSNSVTDEISITYLATGLTQHAPIPEETEELAIKKLHINEAIEMALTGKIKDLISIASLLKIDYLLKNNLIL